MSILFEQGPKLLSPKCMEYVKKVLFSSNTSFILTEEFVGRVCAYMCVFYSPKRSLNFFQAILIIIKVTQFVIKYHGSLRYFSLL